MQLKKLNINLPIPLFAKTNQRVKITLLDLIKQANMESKTDQKPQSDIIAIDESLTNAIESGDLKRIYDVLGSSPLFMAIYNNQEKTASLLIKKFPEWVNHPHETGYTSLHIAAQKGYYEIVAALIDAGTINHADMNTTITPLALALSNKHEAVACLLIQQFPEWVNIPDEKNCYPLLIATLKGLVNPVVQLIEKEAKLNFHGQTPLTLAIEIKPSFKNQNFVSLLIQKCPILVNQSTETGAYPLHIAANEGYIDVVEQLIYCGADPFVKAKQTPLITAVCKKHEAVASLLIQKFPLLVNMANEAGITPLYIAAQEGLVNTVRDLITYGAVACFKTNEMLPIVIFRKHEKVASLLIQNCPMLINLPMEKGFYPLHIAAQEGLVNTVAELIAHGANIHAKENKQTALCSAAKNGHVEVMRMLLNEGAEYFAGVGIKSDDYKKTLKPMQLAAISGYSDAVELLLNYYHPTEYLKDILTQTTSLWIKSKGSEERKNIYQCTELIKNKLGRNLEEEVLTLENHTSFTWDACFEKLYSQKPAEEDKTPKNKDAAIRYAITSIYRFLLHPKRCLPYLHFLSEELELQWKQEHSNNAFPTFDTKTITLWAHQRNLWPIPTEQFQPIKKESLLERILLAKFKQYGMGEVQNKWTGFIPKKTSKDLLYNNTFFTENRRTINGLAHGNIHNIQRVLMLYAMEAGVIPLNYYQEDGTMGMVTPKEVFSALMRTDISLKKAPHIPLWNTVFDSSIDKLARFTWPMGLHFMLLSNEALAGVLQDYMRFSFGSHYVQMRDLFNEICETQHTNNSLCDELKKLQFEVFVNHFEEAIQIEKERAKLNNVELESDGEKWAILPKNYKPLTGEVRDYGGALKDKDATPTMSFMLF